MKIKWSIGFGAILLMLVAPPAFAWSCDHGLVNTGETAKLVRKKCGPPDYVYIDTGISRSGRFKSVDEYWYYNYGSSRLLQELRFHKGVLESVETPGYGFGLISQHCTPQDIRLGMSAYALVSRCGKPNKKRDHYSRVSGGKSTGGKLMLHTEEWTYDFGSQYLLQNVSISSGRIQRLDTASRLSHKSKRPH
ncbi:MAG: DUF2845 domain-containing protein [Gammaproteobacteria bacterium]